MTQLKQGIADKDQTKANGNFVNADTDKQNAYNNAVAHAEQIISGTPNANASTTSGSSVTTSESS